MKPRFNFRLMLSGITARLAALEQGGGSKGPVYLRDELAEVASNRSPVVPGYGSAFGAGLYRVFTPKADFTLVALRDRAPHSKVRGAVWEAGNAAAPLAVGRAVTPPGDGSTYLSTFDPPFVLLAGKSYLIGVYLDGGGAVVPGSDNSVTTEYPGFIVGLETHYPGGSASSYPGPTIGSNVYPPTFDLISLPVGHAKGTALALDPVDFPTVTNAAAVPAGGVALLDDGGAAAPRLIRKRADGSMWYGAAFSPPPPAGYGSFRLNISAGGDGTYLTVSELQLRAVSGGPSIAQGGGAFDNGALSGDYIGAKAFDGDGTTSWVPADLPRSGALRQVGYTLTSAAALAEYSIMTANGARGPRAWTFEGSADGGVTWVVLDTQVGQAFVDGVPRAFPVANG